MKKFIAMVFLFCCMHVFAQKEWAPIGAKWYYTPPDFHPFFHNNYGYCVYLESTRDTIIDTKLCKILELKGAKSTYIINKTYLYQTGDSIFYYNEDYSKFYLLYDFSKKKGDTIVVHDTAFEPSGVFFPNHQGAIPLFKYVIEEIDSIQSNGIWLKRQKVSSVNVSSYISWLPGNYITEKIGSDVYFFGRSPFFFQIAGYEDGELRCYSDSSITYKSTTWNKNCDFETIINSSNIDKVRVYPNPANNFITLNLIEYGPTTLELFDRIGILQFSLKTYDIQKRINIEILKPGIHFIRVKNENNVVYFRFLKQ
jgi:hypothetical protein